MNRSEEMEKANIRAYVEKLKNEILNHAPDIVTEIKCPDGQYRNRLLLDMATVIEIVDEETQKAAYEEQCKQGFVHQEQPNEDYFEGLNDYLDGTMSV